MNGIVLFEDYRADAMLPLVYWRSLGELRLGRHILMDRCAQQLGLPVLGVWTRDWMAATAQYRCQVPVNQQVPPGSLLASARWVFDAPIDFPEAPAVGRVGEEIAYIVCDAELARNIAPIDLLDAGRQADVLAGVPAVAAPGELLTYPWDLTARLGANLTADFDERDAVIEPDLPAGVTLESRERIHIGCGSVVHATAVLDASAGPIYLSDNVHIGPHAVLQGPLYLGPGCRIHPHAWLHGGNAIGPLCKLGGEVDGCIIHGYSNKQHDGFLGHAVVGSWVNLGAGTVNSDLKNTYGPVRVPLLGTPIDSGQMFFGAVIADHVKTGINTTLPTGAVLGMAATVATGRVAPKFVPSFAWVTDASTARGDASRLLDTAVKVMQRRQVDIADAEVELFLALEQRARDLERAS